MGETETIDHIFFACPFGNFIRYCIRDAYGWDGFPSSTTIFFYDRLPDKLRIHKYLGLFIFAGFAWEMWRTINKMAIEKKFPNRPTEVSFYGIFFLQNWKVLLKEGEREKLVKARRRMVEWCSSFQSSGVPTSDVYAKMIGCSRIVL